MSAGVSEPFTTTKRETSISRRPTSAHAPITGSADRRLNGSEAVGGRTGHSYQRATRWFNRAQAFPDRSHSVSWLESS